MVRREAGKSFGDRGEQNDVMGTHSLFLGLPICAAHGQLERQRQVKSILPCQTMPLPTREIPQPLNCSAAHWSSRGTHGFPLRRALRWRCRREQRESATIATLTMETFPPNAQSTLSFAFAGMHERKIRVVGGKNVLQCAAHPDIRMARRLLQQVQKPLHLMHLGLREAWTPTAAAAAHPIDGHSLLHHSGLKLPDVQIHVNRCQTHRPYPPSAMCAFGVWLGYMLNVHGSPMGPPVQVPVKPCLQALLVLFPSPSLSALPWK